MREVHRRSNHATKVDIDGASSLAKALSSDTHFMDTIHPVSHFLSTWKRI